MFREQTSELNTVPVLVEALVLRPRMSEFIEPNTAPIMPNEEHRCPADGACGRPTEILVSVLPTETAERVREVTTRRTTEVALSTEAAGVSRPVIISVTHDRPIVLRASLPPNS